MPTLYENYNPGDLLYGLSTTRAKCRADLLGGPSLPTDFFITLDQYNNMIFPTAPSGDDPYDKWDAFLNMPLTQRAALFGQKDANLNKSSTYYYGKFKSQAELLKDGKGMAGMKEVQTKQISIEAYLADLLKSKYNPLGLMRELKEEAFGQKLSYQSDPGASEKEKRYYLAIRRSCKHGINYACNNTVLSIKIHFLLDDINLLQIATKTHDSKGRLIITGSELRSVHRNWKTLGHGDKLLFYIKANQVPAPWEVGAEAAAKKISEVEKICPGYGHYKIWDEEYIKRRKAKQEQRQVDDELDKLLGQLNDLDS